MQMSVRIKNYSNVSSLNVHCLLRDLKETQKQKQQHNHRQKILLLLLLLLFAIFCTKCQNKGGSAQRL